MSPPERVSGSSSGIGEATIDVAERGSKIDNAVAGLAFGPPLTP
jgi:hypothetical protein